MAKGKYKIGEREYKKKWDKGHPNYMKEYNKKYYQEHKGKIARRNAEKNQKSWDLPVLSEDYLQKKKHKN